MQTIQKDKELRSERTEGIKTRKMMRIPERRTLVLTAAITGGAFVAGLVMYYYLRKRNERMVAH